MFSFLLEFLQQEIADVIFDPDDAASISVTDTAHMCMSHRVSYEAVGIRVGSVRIAQLSIATALDVNGSKC